MSCKCNIEAARKLMDELKLAYEALPTSYRRAVREALTSSENQGQIVTLPFVSECGKACVE